MPTGGSSGNTIRAGDVRRGDHVGQSETGPFHEVVRVHGGGSGAVRSKYITFVNDAGERYAISAKPNTSLWKPR